MASLDQGLESSRRQPTTKSGLKQRLGEFVDPPLLAPHRPSPLMMPYRPLRLDPER